MNSDCTIRIGGSTVIASGQIIALQNDTIEITKISAMHNIRVLFEVIFDDEATSSRTESMLVDDEPNTVKVRLIKPWSDTSNNSTGNKGLNFVTSESQNYYFSYVFRTFGDRDRFLYHVGFIIREETLS